MLTIDSDLIIIDIIYAIGRRSAHCDSIKTVLSRCKANRIVTS